MTSRKLRTVEMALVTGALALLLAACAGVGRPPAQQDSVSGIVSNFVARVVAADHEGAFALIDIESLVNYGNPQGEFYRSLSAADREFYRRHFSEGVYAYLFRDKPPAAAVYSVAPRDPGVAEVVGRPGKRLLITVSATPAGMRIVRIEKP